jgi:hypothetical protein
MSNSEYQTYTTSTSSVTGERTDLTITHVISGRPNITHVRGKFKNILFDTTGPRMLSGFDTVLNLVGDRFQTKNITVYLSASVGTYTNHLSAVSAFNLYSHHSTLSSLYPTFSGFEMPEVALTYNEFTMNHGYYIVDNNTLQLNISGTSSTGKIDVIVANKAGYITLSDSNTGRIITVSS